jgi:hypothetical protein
MACMRSLSIYGLYGFEISIYILWCALFMHIYVICDTCIIVTCLDYHLITLSFRHLTNCIIYMLKLPHDHILVCNDLLILSHGCIHCHTRFLCQNQVLIVCMTQDQLFHTYGQKCSQITKCHK